MFDNQYLKNVSQLCGIHNTTTDSMYYVILRRTIDLHHFTSQELYFVKFLRQTVQNIIMMK